MRATFSNRAALSLRVGVLGIAALVPLPAHAAEPEADDRGAGAVPTGGAGAILKPASEPAAAPKGKPELPKPLTYVAPRYPAEAEKLGREATVTLQLDIDKVGHVTRAIVVDPAGYGFDEAATDASKDLVFSPARKVDGTPVAARILYRYSFKLTPKDEPSAKEPADKPAAQGLSGTVLITGSDVTLANATVIARSLDGKEHTTTTDAQGHFELHQLPPGAYTLRIESAGYEPLVVDETLSDGEAIEVKYRLAGAADGLEVVVRGDRPPREVTKRTLERREIDRIPGTNGDALRSIQNLPGVARPPAIAGLLIVRGSSPQDTKTFIDGTPVPLIYHFGGLSSVIPTEMLEKIDFYPGNFSAQYGRVMGGIVDVAIRSPKDDGKYHGLAQLDLIDVRAMVEGPIPLLKGWTFAAAGRRSYFDAWLGPVLKSAGAGVTQAPVYYDYQFLVQRNISATSNFRLSFLGSDDGLKLLMDDPPPGEPALSGNFGLHTAFQRLQARYVNDLSADDRIAITAALGRDILDFEVGPFFFQLAVNSITGRIEYTRRFSKGLRINVGADLEGGFYDVNLRLPEQPRPGTPPNQPFSLRPPQEVTRSSSGFSPAGYIEAELSPIPRLKLVPGLRLDYSDTSERVAASPRVNARFDIAQGYPRTTLKGGVGVFHQPPQYQEASPPLGTVGLRDNRAIHYALGVEQEITRHLELSAEGFYKQLDDLVVAKPSLSTTGLEYDNEGRGRAFGGEFLLKYKPDDRFFGWAAYTLQRSTRIDHPGEEERLVSFDQTHILTVLGSVRLGGGWEFGARFRLVSGNLTTPNVCNASEQSCDPSRTSSLLYAGTGSYIAIPFAAPNSERLPLFHQLDIRVDKRWKFKSWQLSAYVDLQNVYNYGNAEGLSYNFNYTARQYVSGLPILPNIGLRADF
jgi:TonB family protein